MREGSRQHDSVVMKKLTPESKPSRGEISLTERDVVEAGNAVGQDFTELLKGSKEDVEDSKRAA